MLLLTYPSKTDVYWAYKEQEPWYEPLQVNHVWTAQNFRDVFFSKVIHRWCPCKSLPFLKYHSTSATLIRYSRVSFSWSPQILEPGWFQSFVRRSLWRVFIMAVPNSTVESPCPPWILDAHRGQELLHLTFTCTIQALRRMLKAPAEDVFRTALRVMAHYVRQLAPHCEEWLLWWVMGCCGMWMGWTGVDKAPGKNSHVSGWGQSSFRSSYMVRWPSDSSIFTIEIIWFW